MKKPSDIQIRFGKIVYGILLICIGIIAIKIQGLEIQESIFGQILTNKAKEILSLILIGFGIIPALLGAFDLHFLSSGKVKILHISFGILLIWISSLFLEQASLGVNILYIVLGIFTIIGGALGKFINTKGKKYGQKVTKIRI